jgi:uncharacterized protein (DUF924 family)
MHAKAEEILAFWIDELGPEGWYEGGDRIDALCRERFLDDWEKGRRGDYAQWTTTARGALALLILLDQFPRNMFRGESRSYVTDKKAQETAEYAVDHAVDRELPEFQRMFLYMPLMHSENLSHQRRSVELFRGLGEGDAESYAVRHMEIVERFGRFPHRNDVLGRPTTAEEAEFLKEPGSSF